MKVGGEAVKIFGQRTGENDCPSTFKVSLVLMALSLSVSVNRPPSQPVSSTHKNYICRVQFRQQIQAGTELKSSCTCYSGVAQNCRDAGEL